MHLHVGVHLYSRPQPEKLDGMLPSLCPVHRPCIIPRSVFAAQASPHMYRHNLCASLVQVWLQPTAHINRLPPARHQCWFIRASANAVPGSRGQQDAGCAHLGHHAPILPSQLPDGVARVVHCLSGNVHVLVRVLGQLPVAPAVHPGMRLERPCSKRLGSMSNETPGL